ncbi:hypothetical protein PGT21_026130 [Puccinia graminis f. sp. tritici]|uniref:Uncharacterized protein n=1 Tax=Puccinia graminis f. sp. tritici TaxID=56615 RepID=A0A5B0RZT9_PUCGR|nr:hypothetical protein PGT21_026130 [Puccinia graminis f. sp. tritici]KAA1131107.1 hypothetical protein PGTUg99_008525 [Puccinia graminis f. sp. tritici]
MQSITAVARGGLTFALIIFLLYNVPKYNCLKEFDLCAQQSRRMGSTSSTRNIMKFKGARGTNRCHTFQVVDTNQDNTNCAYELYIDQYHCDYCQSDIGCASCPEHGELKPRILSP